MYSIWESFLEHGRCSLQVLIPYRLHKQCLFRSHFNFLVLVTMCLWSHRRELSCSRQLNSPGLSLLYPGTNLGISVKTDNHEAGGNAPGLGVLTALRESKFSFQHLHGVSPDWPSAPPVPRDLTSSSGLLGYRTQLHTLRQNIYKHTHWSKWNL